MPSKTSHGDQARNDLQRLLHEQDFRIVHQPILDLYTGKPVGFEALLRTPDWCQFNHVGELFALAEHEKKLWDLELISRPYALSTLSDLDPHILLFVNCTPRVFVDDRFYDTLLNELDHLPISQRNRIVLELTELDDPDCVDHLATCFERVRKAGFRTAIDDVGAGTSGLNKIMRLRPDWIKLDRELVQDIDNDPIRQNLVRFFVHFAKLSNINLITEGVEREEELKTLIDLNVEYAQGFLLGRPGRLDCHRECLWDERITLFREQAEKNRLTQPQSLKLRDLAQPLVNCPADCPPENLAALIANVSDVQGIAVMDGRHILGYVPIKSAREWAQRLNEENTPNLLDVAAQGWIVVSPDTTVAEALLLASNRSEHELAAPLLVATDDIVGFVSFRRLIRTIAKSDMRESMHTSSLTGLPSRVAIDQELQQKIETVNHASVAFVDLRRLRDFNEAYGFDRGDALIRHLAGLIVARFVPPNSQFVGHLSDDRFIILSDKVDFDSELLAMAHEFDIAREQFFLKDDWESGQIASLHNRPPKPLTSLRIVLLPKIFARVAKISDIYHILDATHQRDSIERAAGESNVIVQMAETRYTLPQSPLRLRAS